MWSVGNGNTIAVAVDEEDAVRPPRNIPKCLHLQRPGQSIGEKQVVQMAAMQSGRAFCGFDARLELALGYHGSNLRRWILPISTDDEGSFPSIQEAEEVC